jgi:hypothetical protein
LDGRPLPPQYQTALGGEGSLPGYEAFELACGARENTVYVQRPDPEEDEEPVVPTFLAYGCDRSLLVQLEYRSEFGGALPLIGDGRYGGSEWLPPIDFTPGWTVFSNFGRGWSLSEEPSGLLVSRGTRARTDVGVGLLLGGLGFYWAYPLEGEDRAANFFIRLTHRF